MRRPLLFWLALHSAVLAAPPRSSTHVEVRYGSPHLRHEMATWVGFTADGRSLLSYGHDGLVRRWSVADGAPLGEPIRSSHAPLLGDGGTLLAVVEAGSLRILDAVTGRAIARSPLNGRTPIAISRRLDRALLGEDSGAVRLARLSDGHELWSNGGTPDGDDDDPPGEGDRPSVLRKLLRSGKRFDSGPPTCALSHDGRRLARIDPERGVAVHDASTGAVLRWPSAARRPADDVAFLGAAHDLLLANREEAAYVPADSNRQPVTLITESDPGFTSAARIAVTTDGLWGAFSFSSDRVFVYDFSRWRIHGEIPRRRGGLALLNPAPHLAFSPDGRLLAIADGCATLRLLDVAASRELPVVTGHVDVAGALATDARTTLVASATGQGAVHVWNAATGRTLRTFEGATPAALALSPDGKLLAHVDDEGHVHVQDWRTARELWSGKPAVEPLKPIPESELWRGDSLFQNPQIPERKRKVLTWVTTFIGQRVQQGIHAMRHESETRRVDDLAFSPDGQLLASAGPGDAVYLRNARSGRVLREIRPLPPLSKLAFSRDGTHLFGGTRDGALFIWNAATGAELRRLDAPGDPDYRDVADIRPIGSGRVGWATCYGSYSVADVTTGELLARRHFQTTDCAAIAPDGDTVAVGGDTRVELRSLRTGALRATLRGHLGHAFRLRFTSDGRRLICTGMDGTILIHRVPR